MSEVAARRVVLDRIQRALADHPGPVQVPRDYRMRLPAGVDVVERFTERVRDYRATVRSVAEVELPEVIGEVLAAIPARTVVVPDGVPGRWLERVDATVLNDTPMLGYDRLDATDVVVTTCALAIAETGTIVLDAGLGQGRRALSLLPDHHLCIVRADQIVGDVPEAVQRLDPGRPLTWISGPSATSDIELQRIEGVHGPRHLVVLVVVRA